MKTPELVSAARPAPPPAAQRICGAQRGAGSSTVRERCVLHPAPENAAQKPSVLPPLPNTDTGDGPAAPPFASDTRAGETRSRDEPGQPSTRRMRRRPPVPGKGNEAVTRRRPRSAPRGRPGGARPRDRTARPREGRAGAVRHVTRTALALRLPVHVTRFVVVAASAGRAPAWAAARSRAGFKSLPGGGGGGRGGGAAARCAGREGRREGGGGGCFSKMADGEAPLLRPRDGGPGAAAESVEPAPKRQRLNSEDGVCGRGAPPAHRPDRGAGPPPAAAAATEPPGDAAAVSADGDVRAREEDGGATTEGRSGADNRAAQRGLARAEPPPQPRRQGRGEGAEAAPGEDAAEAAIGCERAQRSNGAAGAPAPQPGEDPTPSPVPPRGSRGSSREGGAALGCRPSAAVPRASPAPIGARPGRRYSCRASGRDRLGARC